MGEPERVGALLSGVIPTKTSERSQRITQTYVKSWESQRSKFERCFPNVRLTHSDFGDGIITIITVIEHWRRCVACKPEGFTTDDNCKMPLRPHAVRKEPEGPLTMSWSQCQVYRKWAVDRERFKKERGR